MFFLVVSVRIRTTAFQFSRFLKAVTFCHFHKISLKVKFGKFLRIQKKTVIYRYSLMVKQ
nr:MAG TPA: hypothetical protein [Bacteriophage sp.]